MPDQEIFARWLELQAATGDFPNVLVHSERDGGLAEILQDLAGAVVEAFAFPEMIDQMGYPSFAELLKTRLPTEKRLKSGHMGEILATLYVDEETEYWVPVRRLRYLDHRKMAMRGDDVLAFSRDGTPTRVLKVEAKSRQALAVGPVNNASEALMAYEGRPNPTSLGFVVNVLWSQDRHAEALRVQELQERHLEARDVSHLIFTLSGNDPRPHLEANAESPHPEIERLLVGAVVLAHAELVEGVMAVLI